MRDKVTRQHPQTTTFFQEKGEPQWNQTEALLFISLTPYRWAKLAHHHPVCLQLAYTGKFRACWLINALDCKPSHQGFDSWMRQVEGLFFTSSQSRCVQTHKFLACLSNAQHALWLLTPPPPFTPPQRKSFPLRCQYSDSQGNKNKKQEQKQLLRILCLLWDFVSTEF